MDSKDNCKCNKGVRRGYYSELTTDLSDDKKKDELSGAYKRTKLLWQVRTEQHAPIVKEMPRPTRPSFLAPAERWMCYEKEPHIFFPVDAFKPKVQMQHDIEPRFLPRNVAIERKRRQYECQSIKKCLEVLQIEPKQLVPSHIVQTLTVEEKFGLYNTVNYLPLELFDDKEFDSRTPEGWLNHALLEGVRHPVPAEAFLPVCQKPLMYQTSPDYLNYVYDWVNVAVTNYTLEDELWHVLTLDGFQRTFKIPRIYLMFKAEDPVVFANRIKSALDLRDRSENSIRYEFYLDCMLLTGTYELDEASLNYIYKNATRDRASRVKNREIFEKFEFEVRLNHKRALGELQFRYSAEKEPNVYRFLNLSQREVPRVPLVACVATDMVDFKGMAEYFRWMSIWVIPETHRGMSIVHKYCTEASVMSLFTNSYGKHVTLEEFVATQSRTTDNVITFLKMTWLSNISRNIRMCLGDIGKGWFDVNEKHPKIFDTAKLIRFMEVVKYRMQYALRLLVENSTQSFVNLVETPCQCCLHVNDDYVWESDFIDSPFKPYSQPIFGLLLKMDPTDGAFYSTDPRRFKKELLNLYDTGVLLTHYVNQVHPSLLKHLKFPSDLYLSSVGLLDEDVCALRERLLKGYDKAIIPLLAYADTYSVHMELYTLNINTYIRETCNLQVSKTGSLLPNLRPASIVL